MQSVRAQVCFALWLGGYNAHIHFEEQIAMANKRAKQKKPKQDKMSGQKGGSAFYDESGSSQPAKKKKNKNK